MASWRPVAPPARSLAAPRLEVAGALIVAFGANVVGMIAKKRQCRAAQVRELMEQVTNGERAALQPTHRLAEVGAEPMHYGSSPTLFSCATKRGSERIESKSGSTLR